MLVGLIILIPMLVLVAFTIWCIYQCRLQTIAYLTRTVHPSTRVEKYGEVIASEAEESAAEGKSRLEILDSYFIRGPTILSGQGGGWGLTRHLTQVQRRRRYHPLGWSADRHEKW
jgi:hypothetical protein